MMTLSFIGVSNRKTKHKAANQIDRLKVNVLGFGSDLIRSDLKMQLGMPCAICLFLYLVYYFIQYIYYVVGINVCVCLESLLIALYCSMYVRFDNRVLPSNAL